MCIIILFIILNVSENTKVDGHRYLMSELTTISKISGHENIVNLIGACTNDDGK